MDGLIIIKAEMVMEIIIVLDRAFTFFVRYLRNFIIIIFSQKILVSSPTLFKYLFALNYN